MRGRLAFSYTGLHSTVERFLDARRGEIDDRTKLGVARSFQKAAVGQLEDKLVLGMRECAQKGISVRHLVVSGGVASNSFLRERYVTTDSTRRPRRLLRWDPPGYERVWTRRVRMSASSSSSHRLICVQVRRLPPRYRTNIDVYDE